MAEPVRTRVQVTQEHITRGSTPWTAGDMGTPTSFCRTCPLALAFRGAFPDAAEVVVGIDIAFVDSRGYRLPDEAKAFALAEARCEPLQPFAFEVSRT